MLRAAWLLLCLTAGAGRQLDFGHVLYSNLGGVGPDVDALHGIRFVDVALVDGVRLDALFVVDGEEGSYAAQNASLNGARDNLGVVNVKAGTHANLRVKFFRPDTAELVAVDEFFFTVLNLRGLSAAQPSKVTVGEFTQGCLPDDTTLAQAWTGQNMMTLTSNTTEKQAAACEKYKEVAENKRCKGNPMTRFKGPKGKTLDECYEECASTDGCTYFASWPADNPGDGKRDCRLYDGDCADKVSLAGAYNNKVYEMQDCSDAVDAAGSGTSARTSATFQFKNVSGFTMRLEVAGAAVDKGHDFLFSGKPLEECLRPAKDDKPSTTGKPKAEEASTKPDNITTTEKVKKSTSSPKLTTSTISTISTTSAATSLKDKQTQTQTSATTTLSTTMTLSTTTTLSTTSASTTTVSTTTEPYNCTGHEPWEWDEDQQSWCCKHHSIGCPVKKTFPWTDQAVKSCFGTEKQ
jgi:hypothetical protein